jgi:hypothetical protein
MSQCVFIPEFVNQDKAYNNLTVTDTLVSKKIKTCELNANNILLRGEPVIDTILNNIMDIDNILIDIINNTVIPPPPVPSGNTLNISADTGNLAIPLDTSNLIVTGVSGISTLTQLPNTLTINNLRDISQFIVGQDSYPNDSQYTTLQAALNDAAILGYGTIFIRPSNTVYVVGVNIVLPDGYYRIIGLGGDARNNTQTPGVILDSCAFSFVSSSNGQYVVENIVMRNNLPASSGVNIGTDTSNVMFNNCRLEKPVGFSGPIINITNTTPTGVIFNNCICDYQDTAVIPSGATSAVIQCFIAGPNSVSRFNNCEVIIPPSAAGEIIHGLSNVGATVYGNNCTFYASVMRGNNILCTSVFDNCIFDVRRSTGAGPPGSFSIEPYQVYPPYPSLFSIAALLTISNSKFFSNVNSFCMNINGDNVTMWNNSFTTQNVLVRDISGGGTIRRSNLYNLGLGTGIDAPPIVVTPLPSI